MGHYELGKEYFIKARVADIGHDGQYPLRVLVPVNTPLTSDYTSINMANVPGLLLTAEEVASGVKDTMHRELAKTNAALSNEIGKQNVDIVNFERTVEELREENKALRKKIDTQEATIEERTIECNRWEGMCEKASEKRDGLRAELESIKKDRDNLKENFDIALKNLADTGKTCNVFKKQRDEALKDKDDLQKALEALNKDIDGYRAAFFKMASVIGFLCGGGQNG
jgi:chromosome segregation ATPase